MSRIAAGLWIVRDPHGEVVEHIICASEARARDKAADLLQMEWDSLAKLKYVPVQTDIWSLH